LGSNENVSANASFFLGVLGFRAGVVVPDESSDLRCELAHVHDRHQWLYGQRAGLQRKSLCLKQWGGVKHPANDAD
jgi:hypothetical protein